MFCIVLKKVNMSAYIDQLTDIVTVKGCDYFMDNRADEQDAFSVYISKGLKRGKDWLGIDCYFVNGTSCRSPQSTIDFFLGWWDTHIDGKYPEYAADQYWYVSESSFDFQLTLQPRCHGRASLP